MPYKSPEQRAYLHINEPEIAAKWDAEMKSDKKQTHSPSAYAKAIRAGSQSPMGKKKTSATGAVGGGS
jgi:hypothetical protein